MLQPQQEGSLGENGYMYMYGWAPSLFTWNYHNIVSQLHPKQNKKLKKKLNGPSLHDTDTKQGIPYFVFFLNTSNQMFFSFS